jgi:preprotein translocase subunit SecE
MSEITEKTVRYIREVKSEMSKVTWPSWPELKGSTILVLILSIFFAVFIGIVDFILSLGTRFIR